MTMNEWHNVNWVNDTMTQLGKFHYPNLRFFHVVAKLAVEGRAVLPFLSSSFSLLPWSIAGKASIKQAYFYGRHNYLLGVHRFLKL